MSTNTSSRDVRTRGLVLRRTNYGEAERILSVITPEGKMAVMAKGVRRPRSKLAGAVEMFTLSELNVHFGRSGMGVLTGAKMLEHYGELVKDLERLELASMFLKMTDRASENSGNSEFYEVIRQGLEGLNKGVNPKLVETWFLLNLKKAVGEEINLYRDTRGQKLVADERYEWNEMEEAFDVRESGSYGANEIKVLRLLSSVDLKTATRIKVDEEMIDKTLSLAKRWAQ